MRTWLSDRAVADTTAASAARIAVGLSTVVKGPGTAAPCLRRGDPQGPSWRARNLRVETASLFAAARPELQANVAGHASQAAAQ
jgi:hypothetical protein